MRFDKVISELKLEESRNLIGEYWDKSEDIRNNVSGFMDSEIITENMKEVQIPEKDHDLILKTAEKIKVNEAMFRLAEHAYWTYAISDDTHSQKINK